MAFGSDELNAVIYTWWLARRPQGWTEEQHLADPTVNCWENDKPLAQAMAGAVRNMTLMVPVQQCWEAVGGNPGIRAERQELLNVLTLMDQAEDEVQATTLTLQQISAATGIDITNMTPAHVQTELMLLAQKVGEV